MAFVANLVPSTGFYGSSVVLGPVGSRLYSGL